MFAVDEAKSFISRMRDEYSDATHNVPAFIIGYGTTEIKHCNDDGEPSGTAGKPVLAVLSGSKLGDVAIVVTRYFGGTKLGIGGLVRAYTRAAKSVVDIVPRAVKLPTTTILLGVPYPLLELIRLSITGNKGDIIDEVFSSEVTITARFPINHLESFRKTLQDISRGEIDFMIIEENESIFPYKD